MNFGTVFRRTTTLFFLVLLSCLSLKIEAEDLSGMRLAVIPRCSSQDRDDGYVRVCAELLSQREIDEVQSMHFVDVIAYKPVEDGLILAAKMKKSDIAFYDRPAFTGEISTYLEPVGENHYAIKVRFKGIEKAKLNPLLINFAGRASISLNIDGREANERTVVESWPVVLKSLQSAGAQYETMNFSGGKFLESKLVNVFRGAKCLKSIALCHVIYDSDGGSLESFISNSHAAHLSLDEFVLVGIPSSNENRIGELLKGVHQESFDAFLGFVADELRQTVEKGELPKGRYVAGYSNGGAWAFDALLLHHDLFDGAIVMSPGAWELQSRVQLKGKKVFVGAGELERGFFKMAREIEKTSADLGAEVKSIYLKSGHTMNTWAPIWNMALKSLVDSH